MKKNFVVFLAVQDGPSYMSGRRMVVRIKREGSKEVYKCHVATGASRRRMLRVLERMGS